MLVAVDGVCEPQRAVFGGDDVVGAVEWPSVEIVEQGAGSVRGPRGHGYEGCGLGAGALRAEDEGAGLGVVAAAVREVGAVGCADFVTREVGGGVEG